ncbi:hypothetical protein JW710_01725 [Candidatus Dojkabacteria bacterium]|nr:hypothetical protein [Candidatus Dojkabacteria bacterium]
MPRGKGWGGFNIFSRNPSGRSRTRIFWAVLAVLAFVALVMVPYMAFTGQFSSKRLVGRFESDAGFYPDIGDEIVVNIGEGQEITILLAEEGPQGDEYCTTYWGDPIVVKYLDDGEEIPVLYMHLEEGWVESPYPVKVYRKPEFRAPPH